MTRIFFLAPALVMVFLMGCSKYPEACWPDIRCWRNCAGENLPSDTCKRICDEYAPADTVASIANDQENQALECLAWSKCEPICGGSICSRHCLAWLSPKSSNDQGMTPSQFDYEQQ